MLVTEFSVVSSLVTKASLTASGASLTASPRLIVTVSVVIASGALSRSVLLPRSFVSMVRTAEPLRTESGPGVKINPSIESLISVIRPSAMIIVVGPAFVPITVERLLCGGSSIVPESTLNVIRASSPASASTSEIVIALPLAVPNSRTSVCRMFCVGGTSLTGASLAAAMSTFAKPKSTKSPPPGPEFPLSETST